MEIKGRFKSPWFILCLLLTLVFISRQDVFAAAGSINAVPDAGSFIAGSVLNVAIKIDGGGVAFNAAKATVGLSPNTPIQRIQLGDCGFAFIKTPITTDPSFVGVILGDSIKSCTAYTMQFQALTPGSVTVNISDGSIKAVQGAKEELLSEKDANFTIIQSSNDVVPEIVAQNEAPGTDANGNKLYSVSYSIVVPKNVSAKDVKIALDSKAPSSIKISEVADPESRTIIDATFDDVPEGTHTLSAVAGDEKISEQIVYLDGDNKNVSFGNTPVKTSQSNTWLFMLAGVLLILALLGVVGFVVYKWYKNHTTTTEI